METQTPEIVEVTTAEVSCDSGPLGHPKVFLEIGEPGYVDCPYCGRRFVKKAKAS